MSCARLTAIAFCGGSTVIACAGAAIAQPPQAVGAARVSTDPDARARAGQ